MIKYFVIAICSGILSSFSQILLKKSTEKEGTSVIGEYFNLYVIAGYAIMMLCMLLTVIAYRGLPFKYGAVLESLIYFYIMILSKLFLKEKLTKKKIAGNIVIGIGVIVFSMGR